MVAIQKIIDESVDKELDSFKQKIVEKVEALVHSIEDGMKKIVNELSEENIACEGCINLKKEYEKRKHQVDAQGRQLAFLHTKFNIINCEITEAWKKVYDLVMPMPSERASLDPSN